MTWLWWLSGPVVVPVLVACCSWLRSRPARVPAAPESIAAHGDYLDALVQTARSRDRGLRAVTPSPSGSAAPDPAASEPTQKESAGRADGTAA